MAHLNYHHLRYFRAVAHAPSLTEAANRMNVSQSALSVQIQQLEAQLGQKLFERSRRQLTLTEAGRIALDYADAIFATGRELEDTLTARVDKVRSILRVGALGTLSRNFQIAFLRPLLGRNDVAIEVRSGTLRELLSGLERHELDVVLTNLLPNRAAKEEWIPHRIADQPVSVVGTRARIKRREKLEKVLQREPLILPTHETSIRMSFESYLERAGITPTIAAEVDDMAMIRVLARENVGVAVVPPIVVTDELKSGELVEAHAVPDVHETFYAIVQRRRFSNPLLAQLMDAGDKLVG
jgi:LysR family transcriptional activator of nhaA